MRHSLLAIVLGLVACHRDAKPAPPPAPPPPPQAPTRGAAGDTDLRVMLAEIASSKACTMLRGVFLPLTDPMRADAFGGVLWVRDCDVTQHGTHLELALGGDGWQWVDQVTRKAGGRFALRQYVRFHVDARVHGALDLAYAPRDHVMSIWFTPDQQPDVTFTPLGDLDVDKQGLWSSIIGTLGAVIGQSTSDQANGQAKSQGGDQMARQLLAGFSATMNLCTGMMHVGPGLPAKGAMLPPLPGESKRTPILLEASGLMVQGPYLATHGMTLDAEVKDGAADVAIACVKDANAIADAFVRGQPRPAVKTLAAATVAGKHRLHARATSCPVAVVLSTAPGTTPVTIDWMRPSGEAAAAFGGPLIECKP